MTDAETTTAAQSGHPEAFEALIDRYYPSVYAVAYARLMNRHAAEDLSQEVFLRAYLHVDKLNPAGVGGWLVQVARNLATDWLRASRTSSQFRTLLPLPESPDAAPAAASRPDPLEAQEQQSMIRAAIQALSPELREVVLLHYAEGMGKGEIAERLGVHPSTVGRQIDKALAAMKESLEPMLRDAGPSLKPPPGAPKAALAVVMAAAGLTHAARAAILDAAGETPALAAASSTTSPAVHVGAAPTVFMKGAAGMSPLVKLAFVALAAVGIGVGASQMRSRNKPSGQSAAATARQTENGNAASEQPKGSADSPDYSTPEATAATYTKAVGSADWPIAIACFLPGGTDWQDIHDIAHGLPGTRNAKLKAWMEAVDPAQPIKILSKTQDGEMIKLVWEFTYGQEVTVEGRTFQKGDKGEWDAHFAKSPEGTWLIENF